MHCTGFNHSPLAGTNKHHLIKNFFLNLHLQQFEEKQHNMYNLQCNGQQKEVTASLPSRPHSRLIAFSPIVPTHNFFVCRIMIVSGNKAPSMKLLKGRQCNNFFICQRALTPNKTLYESDFPEALWFHFSVEGERLLSQTSVCLSGVEHVCFMLSSLNVINNLMEIMSSRSQGSSAFSFCFTVRHHTANSPF